MTVCSFLVDGALSFFNFIPLEKLVVDNHVHGSASHTLEL